MSVSEVFLFSQTCLCYGLLCLETGEAALLSVHHRNAKFSLTVQISAQISVNACFPCLAFHHVTTNYHSNCKF